MSLADRNEAWACEECAWLTFSPVVANAHRTIHAHEIHRIIWPLTEEQP